MLVLCLTVSQTVPLITLSFKCLVLLHVPKCFELVQKFCAWPNIYLHILAVTNILNQTKRWFAFSKIVFCAGTKLFEEALNAVKFLGWLKKFGLAQSILGHVKGQGIKVLSSKPYGNLIFVSSFCFLRQRHQILATCLFFNFL